MPQIVDTRIIQTQGTSVSHVPSHIPIFHYIFFNKCHSHLKIHLFPAAHIKLDITFYDSFPKNSRIMKCSWGLNSFLTVGFFRLVTLESLTACCGLCARMISRLHFFVISTCSLFLHRNPFRRIHAFPF